MRALLFMLVANCLVQILPAQPSTLHIFPDPLLQTQCPGNEITYYIFPWASTCPASFTVVGGEVLRQGVYNGKLNVTIVWEETIDSIPGRLALTWGDSICEHGIFSKTWDFPISYSLAYKPIVFGSSQSYPMGIGTMILLEAAIEAPIDTSVARLPTVFEWQAPPEWGIFGYYISPDVGTTDSKKALYISLYNPLTEGCVRVRSQSTCGKWSE